MVVGWIDSSLPFPSNIIFFSLSLYNFSSMQKCKTQSSRYIRKISTKLNKTTRIKILGVYEITKMEICEKHKKSTQSKNNL